MTKLFHQPITINEITYRLDYCDVIVKDGGCCDCDRCGKITDDVKPANHQWLCKDCHPNWSNPEKTIIIKLEEK